MKVTSTDVSQCHESPHNSSLMSMAGPVGGAWATPAAPGYDCYLEVVRTDPTERPFCQDPWDISSLLVYDTGEIAFAGNFEWC